MLPSEIAAEFMAIMTMYWGFLGLDWPTLDPGKYHRSTVKPVNCIGEIKSFVLERLGYIPVFFFVVVLFGTDDYPGPYRHVDKALLILYHLLTGCSIAEMGRFIPRSSFYALYRAFYLKNSGPLRSKLDDCLLNMFSSTKARILCAMANNPERFKHVTMFIDGHDTRASYINAKDHAMFYSYKLKKSGFRTQVCVDINGMILFLSRSAPCRDNNDGTMLAQMDLRNRINQTDCVGLDGGYTLFITSILASNEHLAKHNFVHPIRRTRNGDLSSDESKYNEVFGSFRSKIEAVFGELGHLCNRFDGKTVIKVGDIDGFELQLKVACVLLNMKRFVSLGQVSPQPHHTSWVQHDFDFPSTIATSSPFKDDTVDVSIAAKDHDRQVIEELQRSMLTLSMEQDTDIVDLGEPGEYEVESIIAHRGPKRRREYLVKWVGYSSEHNQWCTRDKFCGTAMVDEYEQSLVA